MGGSSNPKGSICLLTQTIDSLSDSGQSVVAKLHYVAQ